MSNSGGGIGFGTIIFWVFMLNMFGFCDGDDDADVKIEVTDEPAITDQIKKEVADAYEDIKPDLERAVDKAKESFKTVKEDIEKRKESKTKEPEEDLFAEPAEENDSIYGNNDDKW